MQILSNFQSKYLLQVINKDVTHIYSYATQSSTCCFTQYSDFLYSINQNREFTDNHK